MTPPRGAAATVPPRTHTACPRSAAEHSSAPRSASEAEHRKPPADRGAAFF